MHELKAICGVFSFFSFLGVTVATVVHGHKKVEQESKRAQNTLWGKEHTVNHLKVVQSTMSLCTGAG